MCYVCVFIDDKKGNRSWRGRKTFYIELHDRWESSVEEEREGLTVMERTW